MRKLLYEWIASAHAVSLSFWICILFETSLPPVQLFIADLTLGIIFDVQLIILNMKRSRFPWTHIFWMVLLLLLLYQLMMIMIKYFGNKSEQKQQQARAHKHSVLKTHFIVCRTATTMSTLLYFVIVVGFFFNRRIFQCCSRAIRWILSNSTVLLPRRKCRFFQSYIEWIVGANISIFTICRIH